MKKIAIVLTAVFTLIAGSVFAQASVKEGIKVGVGMSNFMGNQVKGAKSITTFTFGGFVDAQMTNFFALQPEANFLMEGANGDMTIFSQNTYKSVNLSYLQIPVLAKFSLPNATGFKPSVYFGPSLSIMLTHNFTAAPKANNIFKNPGPNEVNGGALVGLGADISNVMVDLRYNYDLTDAFRFSNVKNTFVSLTLGYAFK